MFLAEALKFNVQALRANPVRSLLTDTLARRMFGSSDAALNQTIKLFGVRAAPALEACRFLSRRFSGRCQAH